MKKLILLSLIVLNCSMPDIQCVPDLPCTQGDLQYVDITYSPPKNTTPSPAMPSKPVFTIVNGNAQLTLSWQPCTNTNSYNVYISTDGIVYAVLSNATSPFTVTGLTNGTMYYVIVAAKNSAGETASIEQTAMPGVIDNSDGTITVSNIGLTWSKCSQKDAIGNDTYNALNNDCSNGLPVKLVYCMTRFGCDDGTILTGVGLSGTGVSEVYNSCTGRGIGWRVPSADELLALNYYYSSTYWPDIVNDMYYPNNGWGSPQPYGGYVWVNIIGGYFNSANFADPSIMPGYVLCVK